MAKRFVLSNVFKLLILMVLCEKKELAANGCSAHPSAWQALRL